MPVRSSSSRVFKWPGEKEVLDAFRAWAGETLERTPAALRVGLRGSWARGTAGFGSDLDLVVIVEKSDRPLERRALEFDTGRLPVPCDLLVWTRRELERWIAEGGRLGRELREETVWIEGGGSDPGPESAAAP